MKVSIAIAFSLSLFTTSVAVFGTSSASVHIVSDTKKDLFVFKVNKSWQGAKVLVLAANGECVSRQRLMKRRMIINFCDMTPGIYKITITKNNHTEEFQYIKK